MKYPKAQKYLKQLAKQEKIEEVYDLQLIEEVLNHKSFESYLELKRSIRIFGDGHIRKFYHLYNDWLNDKISQKDIDVYKKMFEDGQDIKYVRDYFLDTKEETTQNNRGTSIHLKAYGKSMKIDREVIAFEAKFLDNKLTSFTDKTDNAEDYISYKHGADENDIDLLPNDLNLLRTLIENDCLDVISRELTLSIIRAELVAIQEMIDTLHEIVSKNAFQYLPKTNTFLIDYWDYLRIKNYNLSELEGWKEVQQYGNHYSMNDIADNISYMIQTKFVFNDKFSDDSWTPDMINKLRENHNDDFDQQLQQKIETIRGIAAARISAAKKPSKKKMLLYIFLLVIAARFIYINYQDKIRAVFSGEQEQTATAAYLPGPGEYIVSEYKTNGVVIYKDPQKKSKAAVTLSPMQTVVITTVEDSLGSFEAFTDDSKNRIPKGWIETKYLIPLEGYFTYPEGQSYRVKGGMGKAPVYKDLLKNKKLAKTLSVGKKIFVFKLTENMAYFKSDTAYKKPYFSGWVDLSYIFQGE